jgi:hypothetical protein
MIPFTFATRGRVSFYDDFRSGDFKSAWTVNNPSLNRWHVGTDEKSQGLYGAYISRDLTFAVYNSTTQRAYCYFDINIPYNAVRMSVNFYWKCKGESSLYGSNKYDYGFVMLATTGFNPSAGTLYGTGGAVDDNYERLDASVKEGTILSDGNSSNQRNLLGDTQFVSDSMEFNAGNTFFTAGATRRIIFGWNNDSSTQGQPPLCIDKIRVTWSDSTSIAPPSVDG